MSTSDERLPLPEIFNLNDLFESAPGSKNDAAIVGFRRGSSILVTGPSGTGKSYFALALVREQMLSLAKSYSAANKNKKLVLIYVGLDLAEDTLVETYKPFEWFESNGGITKEDKINENIKLEHRIVTINETCLPVPSRGPAEVIHPIISQIRSMYSTGNDEEYFIVVDTLSAIVKEAKSSGERDRNIHEFHVQLRESLGRDRKCMCVFVSDEVSDHPRVGDTVAEFVFRLSFIPSTGGHVNRCLELIKCPIHTPMKMGSHSWRIIYPENSSNEIAPRIIATKVRKNGRLRKKGRIAVFPHLSLPPIGTLQDLHWKPFVKESSPSSNDQSSPSSNNEHSPSSQNESSRPHRLSTGILGLDEMLVGNTDYWAQPMESILRADAVQSTITDVAGRKVSGGLLGRSSTLLVGPAGSGKSNCCIQFLLETESPERSMYVNFENRPRRIWDWFPGNERKKKLLREVFPLYRRRSQLDFNVLMNEIAQTVRELEIERIAFDGLSDLATIMNRREYELLVEELIVLVRTESAKYRNLQPKTRKDGTKEADRKPITIFLSLEEVEGQGIKLSDSPADNVIVFRQVTINDERRKTIEVRKSRGQEPDRQIRELIIVPDTDYPIRVVPGLDNYRRVMDGAPEPIRVAVQLLSENPAEIHFHQKLERKLEKLFNYEVRSYGFSRNEIAQTLVDIATGTHRIPSSDAKLLNVDEWWVRELQQQTKYGLKHPLLGLNAFLRDNNHPNANSRYHILASDFWAIEIEKACTENYNEPPTEPAQSTTTVIASNTQSTNKPLDQSADTKLDTTSIKETPTKIDENPPPVSEKENAEKLSKDTSNETCKETSKASAPKTGIVAERKPVDSQKPQSLSTQVVALPSHSNFGVFCIHRELADLIIQADETGQAPNSKKLRQSKSADQNTDQTTETEFAGSEYWRSVLDHLPNQWATLRDTWFESPKPTNRETIVDWMKFALEQNNKQLKFGFAFDMETPITTSCAFLELAWAFGAPEDVFDSHLNRYEQLDKANNPQVEKSRFISRHATTRALRFLMFLVAEGLMPARSSLADSRRAAFSRLWCSSIPEVDPNAVPNVPSANPKDGVLSNSNKFESEEERKFRAKSGTIFPVPFFPVGPFKEQSEMYVRGDIVLALYDAKHRLDRSIVRIEAAIEYRSSHPNLQNVADQLKTQISDIKKKIEDGVKLKAGVDLSEWHVDPQVFESVTFEQARELLSIFRWAGNELRMIGSSTVFSYGIGYELKDTDQTDAQNGSRLVSDRKYLPYAMFVDIRDIFEVVRWHEFRLDMIEIALEEKSISSTLSCSGNTSKGNANKGGFSIAGITCEGSWLISTGRTTRSPALSFKFINEITSGPNTVSMANSGAGIPCRKDFYESFGHLPVPTFPQSTLSWNELLLMLGARSYRRSRAFQPRVRQSLAFSELDRRIYHCLLISKQLSENYLKGGEEKENVIKQLVQVSNETMQSYFDWLQSSIREKK